MRWTCLQTRTTRTARRTFRRSEKAACTATDVEDKGISQQDEEGPRARDCWTKQRDDAGGEGGIASVEDEEGIDEGTSEINGFDIAALDKDEENEWQEVVRRRLRASS